MFQLFEQFYPPRFIEAGGVADFAVRFAPSSAGGYAATLYVNDQKVILNGSAAAAPVVEMELQTGWAVLRAGDAVELGAVERRSTLRRAVRATPAAAAQISGAGFSLEDGGSAGHWVVSYSGDKAGTAQGALDVGGRVFPLRVTVTEFPTPRPAVVLVSEAKTAAQVRFKVKLGEAARTAYTAAVTLDFAPDAGLPDDAAVALLPQAVRSVPVRIEEGAAESAELAFQTGTTAGRITVGVTLGAYSDQSVFRVIAEPVVLTAVKASAASANAEIVLTGYDTTRSVTKAAFTFYRKDGQAAAPGRIEADVSGAFGSYFKSSNGGAFTLRANFPVSGTHTELEGVEVELVSAAGTRQSGRLRFE
ncbi:MAG: hypothetical protein HY821_25520 [Acidobacteria bacterium]|nr:hypothetical protein [Acidobacteriota bacterium]